MESNKFKDIINEIRGKRADYIIVDDVLNNSEPVETTIALENVNVDNKKPKRGRKKTK